MTQPEDDLTRGECVEACPKCAPTVPQQPTTRECGCDEYRTCALHCVLKDWHDAAQAILVRALFAVAGQVAAGASPADAVADVRGRFGI